MGDSGGWTLEVLLGDLARVVNSDVALVCRDDGDGQRPTVVSSWGVTVTAEEIVRLAEVGLAECGPAPGSATLKEVHVPLDPERPDTNGAPLMHAATADVRLLRGPGARLVLGFLVRPQDWARALWAIESYAALIGLFMENPGMLAETLAAASRDSLTGCLTYEGTCHELDREINRSTRGGLQLSICFIDLDDFKQVNDNHGHLRGNEVLAEIAGILREALRSCDSVGRYGGDEFIAILPQTGEHEAHALARRLKWQLAVTSLRSLPQPLTASIGVAKWVPGMTRAQLLGEADTALLAAKALRGNLSANRLVAADRDA